MGVMSVGEIMELKLKMKEHRHGSMQVLASE